jgi:hypothetical protein
MWVAARRTVAQQTSLEEASLLASDLQKGGAQPPVQGRNILHCSCDLELPAVAPSPGCSPAMELKEHPAGRAALGREPYSSKGPFRGPPSERDNGLELPRTQQDACPDSNAVENPSFDMAGTSGKAPSTPFPCGDVPRAGPGSSSAVQNGGTCLADSQEILQGAGLCACGCAPAGACQGAAEPGLGDRARASGQTPSLPSPAERQLQRVRVRPEDGKDDAEGDGAQGKKSRKRARRPKESPSVGQVEGLPAGAVGVSTSASDPKKEATGEQSPGINSRDAQVRLKGTTRKWTPMSCQWKLW